MTRLETAATVLFLALAVALVALLSFSGGWVRKEVDSPPDTQTVLTTVTVS